MGRFVAAVVLGACGSSAVFVTPQDDAAAKDFSIVQWEDASRLSDLSRPGMPTDLATASDLTAISDMSTRADLLSLSASDMSTAPDLTPTPIDFSFYPGCASPGLPTGASCSVNADCCHGLCDSANHQPPRTCCYAKGTNCQSNDQCCSGFCIGGSQCN